VHDARFRPDSPLAAVTVQASHGQVTIIDPSSLNSMAAHATSHR
jgi:hypothetical protein